MSILDPLRINVQNYTGATIYTTENDTAENDTAKNNTTDNNTTDNNTTDNNTTDNNTAESTADIYTAYSDLEHGVNGIHYQEDRGNRRMEIIHHGSRTMKDFVVVVVTTACVLIYLGVFFAMAKFFVW